MRKKRSCRWRRYWTFISNVQAGVVNVLTGFWWMKIQDLLGISVNSPGTMVMGRLELTHSCCVLPNIHVPFLDCKMPVSLWLWFRWNFAFTLPPSSCWVGNHYLKVFSAPARKNYYLSVKGPPGRMSLFFLANNKLCKCPCSCELCLDNLCYVTMPIKDVTIGRKKIEESRVWRVAIKMQVWLKVFGFCTWYLDHRECMKPERKTSQSAELAPHHRMVVLGMLMEAHYWYKGGYWCLLDMWLSGKVEPFDAVCLRDVLQSTPTFHSFSLSKCYTPGRGMNRRNTQLQCCCCSGHVQYNNVFFIADQKHLITFFLHV